MQPSYAKQLDAINLAQQKLEAKRFRTLEKALRSDKPEDMVKASQVIAAIQNKVGQEKKSFFIDPLQFNANLGYKDKPFALSYTTLLRMSKTPVINAIIKTRKNQVADFAEPQEDKYSTGFVIRKKSKNGVEAKMTKEDKKSLATALTNMYKIHIEECFIRNEIPAADRIGYRCTFKTMECEMIINQSVESE